MGNELFEKKNEEYTGNNNENDDEFFKNDSNENKLKLKFKINSSEERIRLVGSRFYERNYNNCKIVIDFVVKDLIEFYKVKYNERFISVTLALSHKITDLSYMFYECTSLIEIYNLYDLNINNVTNISNMFFGCSSLTSLSDMSGWKTSKIIDMSHMFQGCSSLSSIPFISEWKTSNVTDMSYMFYGCSSLSYIDDISNWNIDKVNEICFMFYDCPLLNNTEKILNIFFQKNEVIKIKEHKRKEEEERKRLLEEERKRIEERNRKEERKQIIIDISEMNKESSSKYKNEKIEELFKEKNQLKKENIELKNIYKSLIERNKLKKEDIREEKRSIGNDIIIDLSKLNIYTIDQKTKLINDLYIYNNSIKNENIDIQRKIKEFEPNYDLKNLDYEVNLTNNYYVQLSDFRSEIPKIVNDIIDDKVIQKEQKQITNKENKTISEKTITWKTVFKIYNDKNILRDGKKQVINCNISLDGYYKFINFPCCEVVYLIDSTGSMSSYLTQTKIKCIDISKKLMEH